MTHITTLLKRSLSYNKMGCLQTTSFKNAARVCIVCNVVFGHTGCAEEYTAKCKVICVQATGGGSRGRVR